MQREPLILLPGMMCDERLFTPQVEVFAVERPVKVIEIGGHDSVAALAKDVLTNAPERFALAGLSMGGIVAMEIYRQAPERITRLALLDTNPLAELEAVKAGRTPQMEKAVAGHLFDVMHDEMKPNYLADGLNKKAILDLCMDMAMQLGPDVFIRQSIALRDRPDQQHTLRSVIVPTLILCGRMDRLCPIARHELMHELVPHSTLSIIENAGHLPTLENPAATMVALRQWLES